MWNKPDNNIYLNKEILKAMFAHFRGSQANHYNVYFKGIAAYIRMRSRRVAILLQYGPINYYSSKISSMQSHRYEDTRLRRAYGVALCSAVTLHNEQSGFDDDAISERYLSL